MKLWARRGRYLKIAGVVAGAAGGVFAAATGPIDTRLIVTALLVSLAAGLPLLATPWPRDPWTPEEREQEMRKRRRTTTRSNPLTEDRR